MNDSSKRDVEALEQRLADLDFSVSESINGTLTVASTCEPLFCFVRNTKEELAEVVSDTLASYAKTFFGVEHIEVRVDFTDELPAERPIVFEEYKQIGRIKPHFASLKTNRVKHMV